MSLVTRATRCAIALAAAAAPLLTLISPADALVAPHAVAAPILRYAALGDSYASGYGVPPYSATCGRSSQGYPGLINGKDGIRLVDFAACAGATTVSTVAGGQLDALDAGINLVTISDGGNDIGWSTTVANCLGGTDAQCAASIAATRQLVETRLPHLLDTLYTQVRAAAPRARVIVTGYPRLFSPEDGAYLGASQAEETALNAGADELDAVIDEAAARHGFTFVSVTDQFSGHGVNAPVAWVHSPFDPAAFHPTLDGYQAYAAAVLAAVEHGQRRWAPWGFPQYLR